MHMVHTHGPKTKSVEKLDGKAKETKCLAVTGDRFWAPVKVSLLSAYVPILA